ncbi:MAG TPA: hypothetical protein VMT30_04745 [Candidatus Saccharimonadia bacterium]|nr:hypothetical protein [Candidatus Saccharimonadia bacterium]
MTSSSPTDPAGGPHAPGDASMPTGIGALLGGFIDHALQTVATVAGLPTPTPTSAGPPTPPAPPSPRDLFLDVVMAAAVVVIAPGQAVCGNCYELVPQPPDIPRDVGTVTCDHCGIHFWAILVLEGQDVTATQVVALSRAWNLLFLGAARLLPPSTGRRYRLARAWIGDRPVGIVTPDPNNPTS